MSIEECSDFQKERFRKCTHCNVLPVLGEEYVLYEDRKHQLLLSISGKGLHKWNKQKDEFELFFPYTDRISDLIQDREKDYYWLASRQQGIIRLDP